MVKKAKGFLKEKREPLVFAAIFAVIGVTLLIATKAAGPFAQLEPEGGTRTANAGLFPASGTNSALSGGQAVQFNKPNTGGQTIFIAAAGDIGTSGSTDVTISNLINNDPSIVGVLAMGDIAYNSATTAELAHYDGSWGKFKQKTYPIIGNHEYWPQGSGRGTDYFNYWANGSPWQSTPQKPSAVIQTASRTWYSFNLGEWHFVAINTEKSDLDRVGAGQWAQQQTFLEDDLEANTKACTIVFTHRPYWAGSSTGSATGGAGVSHGNQRTIMDTLYANKADIYLAGHEHAYVSFPKLSPSTNKADPNGIRAWVSGIGGTGPTQEDQLNNQYTGVEYLDGRIKTAGISGSGGANGGFLKLELKPTSYSWQFIDTTGAVRHSGSDTCRV